MDTVKAINKNSKQVLMFHIKYTFFRWKKDSNSKWCLGHPSYSEKIVMEWTDYKWDTKEEIYVSIPASHHHICLVGKLEDCPLTMDSESKDFRGYQMWDNTHDHRFFAKTWWHLRYHSDNLWNINWCICTCKINVNIKIGILSYKKNYFSI